MPQTKYTYSIINNTLNGLVIVSKLKNEITNSAIIIAIDYIETIGDTLDIYMMDALTIDDEIILNELISSHDGIDIVVENTIKISGAEYNEEGRVIIQSQSRPNGYTTIFTSAYDLESGDNRIGKGDKIEWDWGSTPATITSGQVFGSQPSIPTDCKRLRITGKFRDAIRLKEGTIFYHNVPKKGYANVYVACPNGSYYYNNAGTPTLNSTGDYIIVDHFVIQKGLQGTVAIGDELNTETCTGADVPSYMEWWIEIDTPNSDTISNGWIELELYRTRTVELS